ncbi:hypothetical protein JKP88DRAFT_349470 [Tribonema minus]|uniref:Uncharacterized protein n=1 Tax=Tribonema minus TaxID=303371 RepID=A0A836CBS1_9STRA|nr:hypothetical protein JKP88DRAFT_349470 [Tribonema minus]
MLLLGDFGDALLQQLTFENSTGGHGGAVLFTVWPSPKDCAVCDASIGYISSGKYKCDQCTPATRTATAIAIIVVCLVALGAGAYLLPTLEINGTKGALAWWGNLKFSKPLKQGLRQHQSGPHQQNPEQPVSELHQLDTGGDAELGQQDQGDNCGQHSARQVAPLGGQQQMADAQPMQHALALGGGGGAPQSQRRRCVALDYLRIPIVVVQLVCGFLAVTGLPLPDVYEDFLNRLSRRARRLERQTECSPEIAAQKRTRSLHRHWTAFLALLFNEHFPELGASYLRADYSIQCYDARYWRYFAYAVVMAALYPIGTPALYAWLLWHKHRLARVAEPELMPARASASPLEVRKPLRRGPLHGSMLSMDLAASGLVAVSESPCENSGPILSHKGGAAASGAAALVAASSFLWQQHRDEVDWWEMAECMRRLMLTGLLAFILPGTAGQAAVSMFMAFFSAMAALAARPHAEASARRQYYLGTLSSQEVMGWVLIALNALLIAASAWSTMLALGETLGDVAMENRRRTAAAATHPLLDPSLQEHGTEHITVAADAVSSADLINWAVHNGLDPEVAQESCIWYGDLDGLQLGGQLEALQWACANGCPWDERTCSSAAAEGRLEVLQRARASGCPWDAAVCSQAAEYGHLHVLQWARADGCPWDAAVCSKAAENGHLHVLQWARANGCPWDEDVCNKAAEHGHLEVLRWARDNGCPWSPETYNAAAGAGHLEILQWARANGCAWDVNTVIMSARRHRHWEVLEWAEQSVAT